MTNIVMLVKDRFKLTRQALESLRAHTDNAGYTLCLIDDCSSDFRVKRLLLDQAQHKNTTLLRIEKSSGITGQARNLGVAWAEATFGRGSWLYLSDNDVYFTKGWLHFMIPVAYGSSVDGFSLWGGQVHPYHQEMPYPNWSLTEHSMLDGPSWLMRWEKWDTYGPLECKAPGVCQGEDVVFCQKLTAAGGRIGVIHPHVVLHTGLTNSAGQDAPGADVRRSQMVPGVLYE